MNLISVLVVQHPLLDPARAPADLAVFVLARDGTAQRLAGSRESEADQDRPPLLLVGWADSDRALIESQRNRIAASGKLPLSEIVILAGVPSWEAIELAAARATWPFLRQQAELMTRIAGESARLRIMHQQMQEHFRDLEDFILARGAPSLETGPFCDPESVLDDVHGIAIWPLTQILPVASRQLAAISLHVAAADPEARAVLTVEIDSPETTLKLAQWQVPVAALSIGWIRLGLSSTVGGPPKTARLSLDLMGDSGQFRLSAGRRHPIAVYQMKCAGAPDPAGRSLALATFVSPPGIRVKHEAGTLLPQPASFTLND